MIRRGALALLLVIAACTSAAEDQPGSSTTTLPETTTSTAAAPTDPGRLAVLDDSGDVVVMSPDGSNRIEVTTDAGVSAAYTQPVWAPDAETLAWGQVNDQGFAVGIQGVSTAEPIAIPTPNLPFFMSWSPDGERLGILHNGTTGVAFGIVDVAPASLETLDEDAPFYFSWSPEGDSLVTHAGPDRVQVLSPGAEPTTLDPTGPDYLAPHWTGAGTFHVSDGAIVLETGQGRGEVARTSGLTMFVANTQGSRLAVQTSNGGAIAAALTESPQIPGNAVVVIDLDTGEAHTIADDLSLGFFWAPDGEKLLVLRPSGNQVEPMVWSSDGSTQDFSAYRPAATMLQDTFPFFPQYAQSVRFWAPDSSAFAYAGAVDGEAGVWVQALVEEPPTRVSDGRWVSWSDSRD